MLIINFYFAILAFPPLTGTLPGPGASKTGPGASKIGPPLTGTLIGPGFSKIGPSITGISLIGLIGASLTGIAAFFILAFLNLCTSRSCFSFSNKGSQGCCPSPPQSPKPCILF